MSIVKTAIDQSTVEQLLRAHFGNTITQIDRLPGGELSQAFSALTSDGSYVLRINRHGQVYAKDAFAAHTFASAKLPIPAVLASGQLNNTLVYAISVRAPGDPLNTLSAAAYQHVLPQLMQTLDAIHQTDVSRYSGAGPWDAGGKGLYPRWDLYLRSIRDQPADGFWANWRQLLSETFFEPAVFETIYAQMCQLLHFCPHERWLVHGDYGFDNVLSDGQTITAVIDWSNAAYGDFLYDIARLDFFDPAAQFKECYRQWYVKRDQSVPFYEERIRCYQYNIGLDGLRFYAKSGQYEAYCSTRERLLAL